MAYLTGINGCREICETLGISTEFVVGFTLEVAYDKLPTLTIHRIELVESDDGQTQNITHAGSDGWNTYTNTRQPVPRDEVIVFGQDSLHGFGMALAKILGYPDDSYLRSIRIKYRMNGAVEFYTNQLFNSDHSAPLYDLLRGSERLHQGIVETIPATPLPDVESFDGVETLKLDARTTEEALAFAVVCGDREAALMLADLVLETNAAGLREK